MSGTKLLPIINCHSRVKAMNQLKVIYKADDGSIRWNKSFKLDQKSADAIYELASKNRNSEIKNRKNKKNKTVGKKTTQEVVETCQDVDGKTLNDIKSAIIGQENYNKTFETVLSRIWAVLSAMQQDMRLLANPNIIQEANEAPGTGT